MVGHHHRARAARSAFILVGAAVIENFSPIFIFGAFLVWTAIRQAFPGGEHDGEIKTRTSSCGCCGALVHPISNDFTTVRRCTRSSTARFEAEPPEVY